MTKRRLARLRRKLLEPGSEGKRCAIWVGALYMEPHGHPKYRVWGRWLNGEDSSPIGEGSTIWAAVRDAEKRLASGDWKGADAQKQEEEALAKLRR